MTIRRRVGLASAAAVAAALPVVAVSAPAPAAAVAPVRAASSGSDLVVAGHGWGHRRGLGQFGSLGYAVDHGWSTAQILDHFYGGTSASTVDPNQEMTVRINSHDQQAMAVQVDAGALATYALGGSPVGASGRAVKVEPVAGGFRVSDAATCAGPWTTRPGTVGGTDLRVRAARVTTITFGYGTVGDVPLSGDWNGDGVDSPGVWRSGRFHLRNGVSGGPADLSFGFGKSTDVPIVGDWNGDGIDTVGVRRGNIVFLRNANSGGGADTSFSYGSTTDKILVGDWNGDRIDTVGVKRGSAWLLRNSNASGAADISFTYGVTGDVPVVGDWDGNGRDGVGVHRGTTWHLRDTLASGGAERTFTALGEGSPVAGHWTGAAADFVGRVGGSTWELGTASTGGGVALLDGNDQPLDRTLQLCHATRLGGWTSSATATRFYRGELRSIRSGTDGSAPRVVNALGLDWYVRGVVPRESPASWGSIDCWNGVPDCGQRALEAQSVAARSYSMGEARYPYAKTCDTTSCQVYGGRAYRDAGSSVIGAHEFGATNNAVATTNGGVRRMSNGTIARTEFSSSTGGWTAGGVFPSVVDDGDDTATNPNHNWRVTITAAQLAAKYGKGELTGATVTERSSVDNRAVTELRLDFTDGPVTRTGVEFQGDWGLKSRWFDLAADASEPLRAARVGVHRGNVWHLRYDLSGGPADTSFSYGGAGDVPVVGDWNATGIDTPGIRRGNVWYLRNSSSSGNADVPPFGYGQTSDVAIVGDWDGNDTTTVGIRRGNVWFLRNHNSGGSANIAAFSFGNSTDVPIAGDWNGDGIDTAGIFRDGVFHLRNAHAGGGADRTIVAGVTGTPIAGDWDADGITDVGVRTGNTFRLFRTGDGSPMGTFSFGQSSDRPIAGRWI